MLQSNKDFFNKISPNQLLSTAQHLPAQDALTLQDQVIFNILVANTDAHAKNYSMLLSGGPRMAPLYDVSTVLHWDHVNQYHAQKLGGRKRKPADMAQRHWERIADAAGFSPRGIRLRVQELVDAMVARRPISNQGHLGRTDMAKASTVCVRRKS